MAVCPLLTVLGFLLCRARTVGTGDVFLLLCLGLHLVVVRLAATSTLERNPVFEYGNEIVHANYQLSIINCPLSLVVEQPYACERHGNAVLVAGFYDIVVAYAAASLSNIFNSALVGTLYVVTEGEEGI